MNYTDFLFKAKKEWLNNIALADIDSGKTFTYSELQEKVLSVSAGFEKLGIKPGDVVSLHLVNSAEVVISHLAVQFLGAVSCLLDPLIPVNALSYYLSDTNTKFLISNRKEDLSSASDINIKAILNQDDINTLSESYSKTELRDSYNYSQGELSTIFYTSGTTNKPKGVMLSPSNYFNHVKIFSSGCYNYLPSDKLLCFVPFSHGYGSKSIFLPCLKNGAGMYIMRSFHPYKVVEAIDKYKLTHIFGVPSHFQQLLKFEEFFGSLRKLSAAFTAAALLKTETAKEWKERIGFYLDEGYGLIETSTGVSFRLNRLPLKLGDIGTYPEELVEIESVDENFNYLKPNERGEIVIKSESVMLGYLNKKEETENAIRNGWFRTGDMGYKTMDNTIILTGRIKEVINIAGIKVAPFEIEAVLNEHPVVNESAVIGIDDEMYGEIVIAFVKLHNNSNVRERELVKYLQKHLMNFQIPKEIVFIDQFPRNNMGKIDKKKLKEDYVRV
ncbi:MAG: class I adenylate-forming enzyme family protein [Melioribacteraceae bacterium]|nr:class I adenylate-forming enzyme family protein [Melioribacteraceae bacterium]